MRTGFQLDDGHECRGCWVLRDGDLTNGFETITAHEDPAGRFVTFEDLHGTVRERYSLDDVMARAYLESIGLDWR
ncbi:hypothetical protein BJ991_000052 [Microbacterium immunditiarum]|uniref:Uncharacterized protein n=1 Tax=Microbacterium immunditiarum TaxID=337480 RepID=A0A7Y9KJQ6_9MICO|nr:hypothetical protein [Microbacterium immunditiarum]